MSSLALIDVDLILPLILGGALCLLALIGLRELLREITLAAAKTKA